MNIYITNHSFMQCAVNLDNYRLRKQELCLAQIISNILHTTDAYDFIFEDFTKNKRMYHSDTTDTYKKWLFPLRNDNHNVMEWARLTPLHLLFICDYFLSCYGQCRNRRIANSVGLVRLIDIAEYLINTLARVVPYDGKLYGLETSLYRGLPIKFADEKDTIIAYQKYLTAHWKADILKDVKAREALNSWKSASILEPKPRLARQLAWGHSKAAPFAQTDLKVYREGLTNAGRDTRQSTTTGSSSTSAA